MKFLVKITSLLLKLTHQTIFSSASCDIIYTCDINLGEKSDTEVIDMGAFVMLLLMDWPHIHLQYHKRGLSISQGINS